MYRTIVKRLLDITLSISIILITFPIIFIVFILLSVQNSGSTFFFQDRPGKNQKRIRIIKFKSMNDRKDNQGNLLPDKKRITRLGSFLRKTSIDELPQLFNVLIGDMSLIGPRPLLFKYLPLYSKEQLRRHEVKPGITGWAQINGRNSISWTKKFEYDVYYVENISFLLDIKILWSTFLKVLKREDINQSDDRPMQPFKGNN